MGVRKMMEQASEELLAKVRKLMALGESPSEAEAASALEKARTLLARYGLSLSDVDTKESEVTESVLLEKKRLRKWEAHLVFVVCESTFTQALHVTQGDASRVLLIGREVNAVSAAELFAYLHLVVLKLGRTHGKDVNHLESFKLGVVSRIGERLHADDLKASDNGRTHSTNDDRTTTGRAGDNPVASDREVAVIMTQTSKRENSAYIADRYGKTKTKRTGRRVDAESYYAGRAAGDGVSLNRQIRDGARGNR
jgi:hypothetical protein